MADPIVAPNIEFNVGDRGGEYLPKLQALAEAVDTSIEAFNLAAIEGGALEDYLLLTVDDWAGTWDAIVLNEGALLKPATSAYGGVVWRLEIDIADVTLAAVPSDENPNWSRESARFATAAQGLLAASAMQPGAGGWLGNATAAATSDHANNNTIGSFTYYQGTHLEAVTDGYPDIGGADGTAVKWIAFSYGSTGKVVQFATQFLAVGDSQGKTLTRINESGTWTAWDQLGTGSGGVSSIPTSISTFTSAMEVSDDIIVDVNFSEIEMAVLNFNGDPLPSTSGDFLVNLSGFPTDQADKSFTRQLKIKRGGRKGVTLSAVDHLAASMTIDFPSEPDYGSAGTSWEMVTLYWTPDTPTVLWASVVDGRA